MANLKPWKLQKKVLPQHTDHAGVMWHGSYLNFLEEGRIDALKNVGLIYADVSKSGLEMPVISLDIKYKLAIKHGDQVVLQTWFIDSKIPKIKCHSIFFLSEDRIAAEASIELAIVSSKNGSYRLVRNLPDNIKNSILELQKGPEIDF